MTLAEVEPPATLLSCPPRYATAPTPGAPNRLQLFDGLAKAMGIEMMWWQRLVLRVITEANEDGTPKYSSATVTVPRQCGKSTLSMLIILERLLLHPKQPQRAVFCAQTVQMGIDFWTGDVWRRIQAAGFDKEFGIRVHRSVADPKMELGNGGHMRILAPQSRGAGHGATYGLGVIDEAWVFQDDRLQAALLPTMRTIQDSQLIIISNAGGPFSSYLRDRVDRGRASVDSGKPTKAAYFEWSSESDELADPSVWREAIPAFGWTVTESKIRDEYNSMAELAFRREVLNQWVDRESDEAIPRGQWMECEAVDATPEGKMVVAIDAPPERDRAVIVVVDETLTMELVWWQNGTEWVAEYVQRMIALNPEIMSVVFHGTGPVSGLEAELVSLGLPVEKVNEAQFQTACGDLAEAVAAGGVRIRSNPRWKQSITGSQRLMRGNQWRIGRVDLSCDVSPLCAAAMAFSKARGAQFSPKARPGIIDLADFLDDEESF